MERMEWEMTIETKKNESDGAKESQSFFKLVENYVHKNCISDPGTFILLTRLNNQKRGTYLLKFCRKKEN